MMASGHGTLSVILSLLLEKSTVDRLILIMWSVDVFFVVSVPSFVPINEMPVIWYTVTAMCQVIIALFC